MHVCMLSCFSHVQLWILWAVACQGPLSTGFSRQEYWSGLPCPPPGDLPNPGIKPASPGSLALQVDFLPLSHQGSPIKGLLFEIFLSGPRSFLQVPCQNHSLQRCSRTWHLLVLFAVCFLLWTNKRRKGGEKVTSTYFAYALAKQSGISYLTLPSLFFKIKKTT